MEIVAVSSMMMKRVVVIAMIVITARTVEIEVQAEIDYDRRDDHKANVLRAENQIYRRDEEF